MRPTSASAPRRPRRTGGRRPLATAAAAALILAACGADDGPDEVDPAAVEEDDLTELSIAIASFDITTGEDQRLMAGVFSPSRQLIAFGEVQFGLAYLGDGSDTEAEIEQTTTASFLGVPGLEPEGEADTATLVDDTGSGVYSARVDLPEPGIYGLQVIAELDDGTVVSGQQSFNVVEDSEVPDVGDEAPAVDNLTIDDVDNGDADPVMVDSRAQHTDGEIPDPQLHDTSIADSIEAGRPVVVAVTTPVYCQTRFCGPLTEIMADLADDYDDRVDVVHLEVWEDFESGELNDAAAAYIQTEVGGNEPWVFLVGADGTIQARWDNVLDLDELLDELEALPTFDAAGD